MGGARPLPMTNSSHLGGERAAETQRTRRRRWGVHPFSDSLGPLRPLRLCGFSRSGRNGPASRDVTNGQSLPLPPLAGSQGCRLGPGSRTTDLGTAAPPKHHRRTPVLALPIESFSRDTSRARISAHFTHVARLGRQPANMCVRTRVPLRLGPGPQTTNQGRPQTTNQGRPQTTNPRTTNLGRPVSAGACGSIVATILSGGRCGRGVPMS
jgi:hypothetical protein